ncbi:MAG TPA: hypothetical protein ENO22_05260 [candidate division Zixibacteria bacterium]|mgnify:CR=1 FL=1|nr:hypothetical protein [candidate division Zixibacteria bacterium]
MLGRDELRTALRRNDHELIQSELKKHPALIRKIQRMLYDMDEEVRWGAARAFGYASLVFDEEKTRDLLRQLTWMINEESGNDCWFAPQAIGEIGRHKPELVKDFVGCLKEFRKYPDSKIQEGIDYALGILQEAGVNISDESG